MKRIAMLAALMLGWAWCFGLEMAEQTSGNDSVQHRGSTLVERIDNLNRKVMGRLAEGREASTAGSSRFKVIFLPPPLGNLPDYGFALGVGVCGLWKTQNDALLYTSRLPLSVKFGFTNPFSFDARFQPTLFFNHNALKVSAEVFYRHRNEHYFGIGYDVNRSLECDRAVTGYQSRLLGITPEVELRLGRSDVYVGAVADFRYETMLNAGSYVAATPEFATIGGTASKSTLTDVGAGVDLSVDTRDNVLLPKSGLSVDARALFYLKGLGGDFNYTRFTLDYRHYQQLFGYGNTLSWGVASSNVFGGNVPMVRYATIGDCFVSRGYYGYQFRDKSVLKAHVEYRYMFNFNTPVGQLLINRFGVAVWGGVAFMGRNMLRYDAALPEVGAGLRMKVTSRSHMRFDWGYGIATRDVMFYVGVNELF